MVIVPLSKTADGEGSSSRMAEGEKAAGNLLRYAAAGSLLAGGAMFLSGCRRSGLVAALVGTALAMLDQQEVIRVWWSALPVYLDEAQTLLTRVQGTMDEVSARQEKVREVFRQATQA